MPRKTQPCIVVAPAEECQAASQPHVAAIASTLSPAWADFRRHLDRGPFVNRRDFEWWSFQIRR